jgi:hypothetical protein
VIRFERAWNSQLNQAPEERREGQARCVTRRTLVLPLIISTRA